MVFPFKIKVFKTHIKEKHKFIEKSIFTSLATEKLGGMVIDSENKIMV
jgi:hypothetical protein